MYIAVQLFEPAENQAEALHKTEQPPSLVAPPVQHRVVFPGVHAVGFRRNHGGESKTPCRAPFPSEASPAARHGTVRCSGINSDHSPRVHGHHADLTGQAAFGAAYRLPTRFFKTPQASGCTGTDMESNNRTGRAVSITPLACSSRNSLSIIHP